MNKRLIIIFSFFVSFCGVYKIEVFSFERLLSHGAETEPLEESEEMAEVPLFKDTPTAIRLAFAAGNAKICCEFR